MDCRVSFGWVCQRVVHRDAGILGFTRVAGIREGPSTRIWVYHGCICKGAAGYLNSIVVASSPTDTRICSTISSGAVSTTVAVPDPGRCIFSIGDFTNNTSTGVGPHDTATSTSGLDVPGHDDRDITPFIDIRGSVSHDDIDITEVHERRVDGHGWRCADGRRATSADRCGQPRMGGDGSTVMEDGRRDGRGSHICNGRGRRRRGSVPPRKAATGGDRLAATDP